MCIIMEIVEKYVPWKEKRKNERPKWFNKEVEAVCKRKRKAWNRWKKSMKEADKETYRKLEKETKGMIRKRKKGLEKIIAKESKSNPKSFYAYINSGKNMRKIYEKYAKQDWTPEGSGKWTNNHCSRSPKTSRDPEYILRVSIHAKC